jgi:excisionase family DNA binding protein
MDNQERALTKLLVSVEESAEILAISKWSLRSWMKKGLVPSVKIGTRRLIRASDLENIAKNGLDTQTASFAA